MSERQVPYEDRPPLEEADEPLYCVSCSHTRLSGRGSFRLTWIKPLIRKGRWAGGWVVSCNCKPRPGSEMERHDSEAEAVRAWNAAQSAAIQTKPSEEISPQFREAQQKIEAANAIPF